ncbi:MAG: hypothetical protein M3044_14370, partial [Thermoproteota archaeon]|nr:hypothetical protein [Thermoproteota archaeon]
MAVFHLYLFSCPSLSISSLRNFIIGCSLVRVSKKFQSVFGVPSVAQSRIVYDRTTKHIDHTRTRGDNNNYLV